MNGWRTRRGTEVPAHDMRGLKPILFAKPLHGRGMTWRAADRAVAA